MTRVADWVMSKNYSWDSGSTMNKHVSGKDLSLNEIIKFVEKLGYVFAFSVEEWVHNMLYEAFWISYLIHSGGSSNDCDKKWRYRDELVMIWWTLNQGLTTHHQGRWRNGRRDGWRFYDKADTRSRQSCSACFFLYFNKFLQTVIILQISIFILSFCLIILCINSKIQSFKVKKFNLIDKNLSHNNFWSKSNIIWKC